MTYSPKYAKQSYLQGFTERHSVSGKAINKNRELKLCCLVYPFAVWLHFFSTAKLFQGSNWNKVISISGAHHRNLIYSSYCTKKAYSLKTNWCL